MGPFLFVRYRWQGRARRSFALVKGTGRVMLCLQ
jgi:hypothetical protein